MKKILILFLLVLCCTSSVFGGEFEDTLKKAEQGDADAQMRLAELYAEGKIVEQNFKKALYWIKVSAERGNPIAQFGLGNLYWDEEKGAYVSLPQDFKKAFYWFEKSAKQGNIDAKKMMGIMLDVGQGVTQDHEQALYWYNQADAICSIGLDFFYGSNAPKNMEKAGYWLKKAFDKDCFTKSSITEGYYELGFVYFKGYGVSQDYKKAKYFFEKSINSNSRISSSSFYLGEIYYQGLGIPKNTQQGIFYYLISVEENWSESQAKTKLIEILDNIDTSQIKNFEYWLLLGVEMGYDYFENSLASFHYRKKNYKKALYWYSKVAEKGSIYAQYMLGELYDFGKGTVENHDMAVYWYKKSAEQGNVDAQYNLAIKYAKGEGVPQNNKLAYVWSSLSAAHAYENLRKNAIINRDIFANYLSPQQLNEAQELAAKLQYRIDHPTETQEKQSSIGNIERKVIGSGTGFFITKDGYILTCHHVIKDANEIKIAVGGNTYTAKLVRDDPNNDLALLKINGSFSAIGFSSNRSAKMGQEVFTIGYPNPSLQGVSAKFTKGTINSLTGFQDDLRLYQISVPVQPGNSGGALLDENGNVLGVVMAMLDAKITFKISGSLPQNVNYAVKNIYAQAMLNTLPVISDRLIKPARSKSDAVERVEKSTVMILSYQ